MSGITTVVFHLANARRDNSRLAQPPVRSPAGVPGLQQPRRPAYAGLAGTLLLVHTLLDLAFLLTYRSVPALRQLIEPKTLQAVLWGGLFMQTVLVFLPVLSTLLIARPPAQDLAGSRAAPGSLILSLIAGIPAAVVFQGLNNLLVYLMVRSGLTLPQPKPASLPALSDLLASPWLVMLLLLTVSVLIPALVEELFFRGVMLAALRSGGADWSAAFWQAAAFALFHADPLFILPPFLAGLLLAYIRKHCQRLWPAMLTHMSLNLSLIGLAPLLPRLTQSILQDQSRQAASLLYASLIAACVAAVALVPLLVLIGHLGHERHAAGRRLIIFPGDWKFALAFILQIATIILSR